MKKLTILPLLTLILNLMLLYSCQSKSAHSTLTEFPTDSIDVYARLLPNEDWISSRHTYGKDSIIGNTVHYRVATDSSNVYMYFDVTLLELHPRITANLISFVHSELLNWWFIDESDTIPPFGIKELSDKGLSQLDICKKILDWERKEFYKQLSGIYEDGTGFNIAIEIYPVYLDSEYVTYKKASYYYTGGMHANYSVFLQTYDRTTGETLNLEDMVCPEKMNKFRKHVVHHMASNYPIYSPVSSVDEYLDSLNRWKGLTDIGVRMGVKNESDRERITAENYPINDPGIHEAGLVITYEKYHLTPGCYGCPTVLLPLDEIRYCLKEPFCNYISDKTKFVGKKERDVRFIPDEEIDSIRAAWSPADDGGNWPRDIYDWYKYRHGDMKTHYPITEILGTWIGYGHIYSPRHILTLKSDGSFVDVEEEALTEDKKGKMQYNYTETVTGIYEYDITRNRLTFKNWRLLQETEENLDYFVKLENPNNEYMIIHSIVGDTMYIANETGDLWPYIREMNNR